MSTGTLRLMFMAKHLGIAYNLRLPPELKEKIAISAQEHNRSMNADIVARLDSSFSPSAKALSTQELIEMLLSRFPVGGVEVRIGKLDDEPEE